MTHRVSALPEPDVSGLRWRPLARLAALLDRQADEADKDAVAAGLLVYTTSRWGRTYRDSRFLTRDEDA
jgi:hypothetical protein